MADPAVVGGIEAAFKTVGRLYIADGHHRAAAAARVSRLSDGPNVGRFLTVLFPHDEVRILDYNRVVYDWGLLRRRKRSWKRSDKSSLSNRCAVVAMETGKPERVLLACISMAPGTN